MTAAGRRVMFLSGNDADARAVVSGLISDIGYAPVDLGSLASGTSYSAYPSLLPIGSLAWVTCQRTGSKVGTTSVWDRLSDGSWVTDYYVATTSKTTYTAPIRRC